MLNPFRRRKPGPPSLPLLLERGLPEAHVAVGSLSGTAPSDVASHLLIVIDTEGRAKLTGNACPELAALVLSEMAAGLARQAYAGHQCGGPETEGAGR